MNQANGPVLFVSHHSSQLEVAQHVERALNAKGVKCWIAPRDVEPGASFARAIPDAIGESSAVLLLFSAASVKSPHVERELILADQLGKAIIPLRIEKIVDPGGLRYHLAAAQWIDWLEQRDAAIDRIAARARGFDQEMPRTDASRSGFSHGGAAAGAYAPTQMPLQMPPAPFGDSAAPAPQGAPPEAPPGAGSSAKWLWITLGGVVAAILVVLLVWLATREGAAPSGPPVADAPQDKTADTDRTADDTSAQDTIASDTTPNDTATDSSAADLVATDAVTEEWFAGVWAETRDCEEMFRFDLGGQVTSPDAESGTWSIENGNTLIINIEGVERRREVRKVSEDEIAGAQGPGYRCLPATRN
ncbi:MAG TPA: toll/interleukin-1 receptor domain-containing protein [Allosphingosinicella sp.]|jgi:hypothetical protein